ncbi:hypothetical protein Q7P37_006291 [Cladosporium fusiforme]
MSADFWAGYISGAVGIVIGNPLDLIKTRIQAGPSHVDGASNTHRQQITPAHWSRQFERWSALVRGAAAPILGYGALNALLFMTYNRSLALLNTGNANDWPQNPSSSSIWAAGALGGLASFVVSAPTELVKCRAQVSNPPKSSWLVTKETWQTGGLRGLYLGGGITSVRDAVGYGFYFWSYELSKRYVQQYTASNNPSSSLSHTQEALSVLLCGGLAGVATWVSIFPLDVIKTRLQTHDLFHKDQRLPSPTASATQPLLQQHHPTTPRPSTISIALSAYRHEGLGVFFRGIGICSARAFVVNAVQWAVYEWTMRALTTSQAPPQERIEAVV